MLFSIFFKKNNGFTLLELLVVITISTILLTAVVFQQRGWNDRLAVSSQAYEMVLMIRQAQIYSLGTMKDSLGTGGDNFNVGYGVYVDQDVPDRYIFFADRNGDKIYTLSADGQATEKVFTRGVIVSKICGVHIGNASETCTPFNKLSKVMVSFFRPEPSAYLNLLDEDNVTITPLDPPVMIYLKSPLGKEYKVTVEINGQISIVQV